MDLPPTGNVYIVLLIEDKGAVLLELDTVHLRLMASAAQLYDGTEWEPLLPLSLHCWHLQNTQDIKVRALKYSMISQKMEKERISRGKAHTNTQEFI